MIIPISNRAVPDALCAINHHESSVASDHWRTLRKICNAQLFSIRRLDAQGLRRENVEELLSYVETCSQVVIAVDIGHATFITNFNVLSRTFFSVDLHDSSSDFCSQFEDIVKGLMDEAGRPNFADYFPVLKRIDPQGIRQNMLATLRR